LVPQQRPQRVQGAAKRGERGSRLRFDRRRLNGSGNGQARAVSSINLLPSPGSFRPLPVWPSCLPPLNQAKPDSVWKYIV
jgi:hypothetical protein